jgi:hypothetical protein
LLISPDEIRNRPAPAVADAAELLSFLGDAEAMRFTQRIADISPATPVSAKNLVTAPGPCARKPMGARSGFGGLYDDPFDPGWGVEVSYRFAPSAWGNGFASELTEILPEPCKRATRARRGQGLRSPGQFGIETRARKSRLSGERVHPPHEQVSL